MTPSCYNRAPFQDLIAPTDRYVLGRNGQPKRVCKVITHQMSDRCASWDSGPSPIEESVPARNGWQCQGCRWLPEKAADFYRRNPE